MKWGWKKNDMNLHLDTFLASSWIFGQALSTSLMNEIKLLVIIIIIIVIIIIIIIIIIVTFIIIIIITIIIIIIISIYSGSIYKYNGSSPYKLKKI